MLSKFKFCFLELSGNFFSVYFWSEGGWIHSYRTCGYRGPTVYGVDSVPVSKPDKWTVSYNSAMQAAAWSPSDSEVARFCRFCLHNIFWIHPFLPLAVAAVLVQAVTVFYFTALLLLASTSWLVRLPSSTSSHLHVVAKGVYWFTCCLTMKSSSVVSSLMGMGFKLWYQDPCILLKVIEDPKQIFFTWVLPLFVRLEIKTEKVIKY